jgi:hypothetical protein
MMTPNTSGIDVCAGSGKAVSIKEIIARDRIVKDTIFVFGIAMAVVAGGCGGLIYYHL